MTAHEKGNAQARPWEYGEEAHQCFYPNCKLIAVIEREDAHVTWDVRLPLQTIYDMFSPVVKLAIEENTKINRKYPSKPLYIYLHPECAAEWGMQLIKDALNSNDRVGRRLSNREKEWGRYGKSKRDYKAEYAKYQGTEEQKKKRAQRNKARRKATREGKVSKGDGKDVAHRKAMDKGGKNSDGVRVETASRNRSFKRDSRGNLVSETSSRERKKKKTSKA